MDATPSYLEQLIAGGLLLPTGVAGLYGRSQIFERVVEAIDALVTRTGGGDGAEVLRFPPGLSRRDFEDSEYLKSFPQLAGTVHSFCGDERAHREVLRCIEVGEDWTRDQAATDIVLTPAACYPVYPVLARRGALPEAGYLIDVQSYCFRHEPSLEPTRMQMFRMREYVRIGTPEQVTGFRALWLERGEALVRTLALPHIVDVANDPFFGRAGRVLADSQRVQKLKFELLIPVNSTAQPTACLSFNYHMDHFGQIWKLAGRDGATAHTACVGFGLERTALALFRHHGFEPAHWPSPVQSVLWPSA
ncbi:MAG: amino acid--[acyl-carrier-protein] ligase [Acidisphaera sp.]|nr:amino acid--[acyl-carrier-protein] ligase [Acidisphaera sp.]